VLQVISTAARDVGPPVLCSIVSASGLATTALIAALLPARRAARLDPLAALRAE
jgi:ABC-type antimicrobial peptide transport system permease subunit